MPRTNLDLGLQELQRQMRKLNEHVDDMLAKTLKVLETGDHLSLPRVIESTIPLHAFCTAVEQQALRLLILQQPLGGRDLRLLTAVLHISEALRQIGDASSELAQTLGRAALLYQQAEKPEAYSVRASPLDQQNHLTDAFLLRGLLLLGEEIQYILHQAMEAFRTLNAENARTLLSEQNLVEIRYAPLCQDIMNMQAHHAVSSAPYQDATFFQRITYLLWMAHKLAEIATHVGTICQRVIFIVEG